MAIDSGGHGHYVEIVEEYEDGNVYADTLVAVVVVDRTDVVDLVDE